MVVARRFHVKGRVQRVGFRMFVQEFGLLEGLHGWVANRPDGSVEVLAEGEADAVRRFERKVRQGPPGARVEQVTCHDEAPSGRPTGFRIEH
jgi:acylphosphatase